MDLVVHVLARALILAIACIFLQALVLAMVCIFSKDLLLANKSPEKAQPGVPTATSPAFRVGVDQQGRMQPVANAPARRIPPLTASAPRGMAAEARKTHVCNTAGHASQNKPSASVNRQPSQTAFSAHCHDTIMDDDDLIDFAMSGIAFDHQSAPKPRIVQERKSRAQRMEEPDYAIERALQAAEVANRKGEAQEAQTRLERGPETTIERLEAIAKDQRAREKRFRQEMRQMFRDHGEIAKETPVSTRANFF